MRRVLRYDGLLPNVMKGGKHQRAKPNDIREMKAYIAVNRKEKTPFDIIVEGKTPGDDKKRAESIVRKWADAGATWWIEALWDANQKRNGLALVRKRIEQGPPKLE